MLKNCKGYYRIENPNGSLDDNYFFNKDTRKNNCDFYVVGSFESELFPDLGSTKRPIGGAIYL